MTDYLPEVLKTLDADQQGALDRLFDLLRIPSVSTDPAYKDHCLKAANWCAKELKAIGFAESKVVATINHPMVVAHDRKSVPKGMPHVLFYGHYDVQPPDPLDLWTTPPFEPRIATEKKNGKVIIARGAEDNKGQLMTFLEAARAWKKVAGDLPIAVTVLLEGEEEFWLALPPGLPEKTWPRSHLRLRPRLRHRPMGAGRPRYYHNAARNYRYRTDLTGPSRDLHSGLYGGPAMNPIRALMSICGAMHDKNGKIAIPGFYDGVAKPSSKLIKQWDSLGVTPENFLGPVGLSEPAGEKGYSIYEQMASRPTLEFNGVTGGYQGAGSKTVIPSKASVKITCRLVSGQKPKAVFDAIMAFVADRLPDDCEAQFSDFRGSEAMAMDQKIPFIASAGRALKDEWKKEPVMMAMGGSIPIVTAFKEQLGMESLLVGFGLDDDRIHSPNEKYNLSSFQKGARSWARILAALAATK